MAKDPAVLLYTSDFLTGTFTMTNEQVGKYIKLLCIQHQKGGLTESELLSVCGGKKDDIIFDKFKYEDGKFFNERMRLESEKRKSYVESRRNSRKKSDEDNVRIYIVRDNVRLTYKIGSSVNPLRRYNELANQENPAIMEDKQGERNLTLVWYSDPAKRTDETDLHEHFEDKRINGEWFSLNQSDLKLIYKKYKGTHVERTNERTSKRTSPRTEDENENTIININKSSHPVVVYSRSLALVSKMDIQLSEPNAIDLVEKFGYDSTMDILRRMNNYKKLLNNTSVYDTAYNWLKRDIDGKKEKSGTSGVNLSGQI